MEVDQDPNNPIVITNFAGQAENPHIGAGVNVGLDLFTVKEVARLSRKMLKKSGTKVTGQPLYITEDPATEYLYVQDENEQIYVSVDHGDTWLVLSTQPTGGSGKGLIVWEDYLFSANDDDIDIYGPLSGSPAWINGWWTAAATVGANQPALYNTVGTQHVMFINPSSGNELLICNGRYIANVEQNTTFTPPANSNSYTPNDKKLKLAPYYSTEVLGYLPPSSIAIGTSNRLNNSQADVCIWDGVQTATLSNIVNLPGSSGPVKQLLTKNGILYAVTDKEHGVYTVNGSSAQLVDRLALRMSNRLITGEQNTLRLASTIYTDGADFLGPELLTGGSNNPAPVTEAALTGLYPFGVWSVNIENQVIGLRFPLSFGDINALYSSNYTISFVKVLTNSKVLVGWGKGLTYGIDATSPDNYITDPNTVFIESSLYEVGTRTQPRTFNQIEYNLIQPLKTGESILFYYRKGLDQPYTLFHTENLATLGNNVSDIISPLPWQASQYIQLGVQFNASTTTPTLTPQFRSIILR